MSTLATGEGSTTAERLYDRPTADAAADFYPIEGLLKPTFDENLPRLGDKLGLTLEQQAAERHQFSETIRAAGLDLTVGRLIHNAWTSARLAPDTSTEEDLLAQTEATRRALREHWGAADAEDLLRRAQKFVKQHPGLSKTLGTGTLGSRRDIVEALVEHVRRVNFR